MTAPPTQRVWYFFSEDLPDGVLIVPIKTAEGLAFGVRPGAMTEEMLAALNQNVEFVIGTGLAHDALKGHLMERSDGTS